MEKEEEENEDENTSEECAFARKQNQINDDILPSTLKSHFSLREKKLFNFYLFTQKHIFS